MKQETLDRICEWALRNSQPPITREEFYNTLKLKPEGMERVLELWQGEVDNSNFPPKDLTLLGYYFTLLDKGMITKDQYNELVSEL